MNSKRTSQKRIISGQLKKMVPQGILLLIISAVICVLELLAPYFDKLAVNDGLAGGNKHLFIKFLIAGFLVTVAGKLVSYINTALFNMFSGKAMRNIKSEVFRRLTNLPAYIFSSNPSGYVQSRMEETDAVSGIFSPVVFKIATSSVTMIGALIYLFRLDLMIFGITLVSVPIIFIICQCFSKKISKLSENINESQAELSGEMQEYIQGASEIKQLNLEKGVSEKVDKHLDDIVNGSIKRSNRIESGTVQATAVCTFIQLIIIMVVGMRIMDSTMSMGDYVSVARYISYVFTPIVLFSTYFLTLQEAVVAGRRIENFFSTSEDKNEDGKCITHINKIELRNISYRYNENADYVFENADIVIDSKDKMCIYGENGSGKTTLIKLITGLINPTGGGIYINNIPLKEINITSVRKRIGVVSQNSYIFSGSLIENIASSSEELVLWSSICDNEVFSGIDWKRGIVIENGKNLSSGQKQKIALARMLVKNPDVIVIDEGITNLDAESKEIILKAADTLFKDKICIFVSHSDDFSAISKRKLIIKNKKLMNCYGSLKRFR